jgi:bifunctional NMN adenylyltransferase/nudix hydrolase
MTPDVGVIVGRFQVPDLHEGHRSVISQVVAWHRKVIICIGVSHALGSGKNPLDYITREKMIRHYFPQPEITIVPMIDLPTDEQWSEQIDRTVSALCPVNTIVLYGGRDSFLPHYKGKFKTKALSMNISVSGTEVRDAVGKRVLDTADFRAGVIYATQNQYPKVFPTVDIAVTTDTDILLVRKKVDGGKWRVPGGFVHPNDSTLEEAAARELTEECGRFEHGPMEYVSSLLVNDWRYRWEKDKIITTLFHCKHQFDRPVAGDDVDEAAWCPQHGVHGVLVDNHLPLYYAVHKHLKKGRKNAKPVNAD